MKTIRNQTRAPVRVPLPRGKVLHLGPLQAGEIAHTDVDHEPLLKLVESGVLEIVDSAADSSTSHEHAKGPSAETHGHHAPTGSLVRGDR